MNLIRYNPTLDLLDNAPLGSTTSSPRRLSAAPRFPAVDMRETEPSHSSWRSSFPGLTEKDVELKLDNNLLTISSAKDEKKEEKKNGYVLRERRTSRFSRSFVLPEGIEREKIVAEFKNGVLHLNFPKAPTAKPKTIEVKSS